MSDREHYTMEQLGRIVTDKAESDEAKLLALSCAREIGKAEGVRESKSQSEFLPW